MFIFYSLIYWLLVAIIFLLCGMAFVYFFFKMKNKYK